MKAGRKRSFDKQVALDKAMRLFWENGYAATGIAQLSTELGINTPSLYAAFGNKEKLFKQSLDHYRENYVSQCYQHLIADSNDPLHQQLLGYYYSLIELFTRQHTPVGCFMIKSLNESDSGAFPEEADLFMKQLGKETEQMVSQLLQSKLDETAIDNNIPITDLVNYLLSVSFGLASQACNGKTAQELKFVAEFALERFKNTK